MALSLGEWRLDGVLVGLDGDRLVLTADTGETQAMAVFRADPGDGVLVIDGADWTRLDQRSTASP